MASPLRQPSNSGYIFLGWRSGDTTYKAGDKVYITTDTTFVAVWGNLPDVKPSEPETPDTPVFPFYDVTVRDWYYSAVKYVYEKGLMAVSYTHLEELRAAMPKTKTCESVLCVPFPIIPAMAKVMRDSRLAFGAQDVSAHESGAYTGEVSAAMLADLGVKYCIVGHLSLIHI